MAESELCPPYFLDKIVVVSKKSFLTPKTPLPRALAETIIPRGWRATERVLRSPRSTYLWFVERSEARTGRLEAALALALLKATTHRQKKERPLPIISVPRLSERMKAHLTQFVAEHGGGTSWAVVDDTGRVLLTTPELVVDVPGRSLARSLSAPKQVDLFTDLNQWLLKVMLADRFPKDLLVGRSPGRFRNASVLASAAGVSLPVVSRLLGQLESEGFLDTSKGDLELVRIADLLERWRMTQARNTRLEIPVRFEIVGRPLWGWIQECPFKAGPEVRVCAGLFDAAGRLGVKHVANAPNIVWLENGGGPVDQVLLRDMGVIPVRGGEQFDFIIRVPRFPEAIFRASIHTEEAGWRETFTDVIQTWMDVSHHPARGQELADRIWADLISPCIGET